MASLEGVESDDCETLGDAVADTSALVEETRSEIREELSEDEPDEERLSELAEQLENASELQSDLSASLTGACGPAAYPTDDGEPEVDSEDLEEWHATVDEMQSDVADTVPDRLVRDDRGYSEEADFEVQKQTFFDRATETKDTIEDYAAAQDYDSDYDRQDERSMPPMTVVCIRDDSEDRQECIEEYTDNWETNRNQWR